MLSFLEKYKSNFHATPHICSASVPTVNTKVKVKFKVICFVQEPSVSYVDDKNVNKSISMADPGMGGTGGRPPPLTKT